MKKRKGNRDRDDKGESDRGAVGRRAEAGGRWTEEEGYSTFELLLYV